ncbi:MAG: D-aminoacylase [Woeseia sp.]
MICTAQYLNLVSRASKRVVVLSLCTLLACSKAPTPAVAPNLDTVLTGGLVFDGDDSEPVLADIGISGDRIVAIGDLRERKATQRIDVGGLAVAPGFIDIHSHAVRDDTNDGIFRWPDAENLIRQGVTTVIGGPDGGSPLPITSTFDALAEHPASVNFGTFVGHGSVRAFIVGEDDRAPTAKELDAMRQVVATAMQDGAFGLSSGLIYAPGRFAATEEVVELAKVAADYSGIYISHMREEGLDVLKSVAETIRIGEEARLPAQITHHKIVGAPMWGKSTETLRLVDEAVKRGVDVSIDQYPYTASSTSLTILFPGWSLDGGREALLQRIRDPSQHEELRKEIVNRIEVDRGGNDPANVVIANCSFDRSLNGMNLSQILQSRESAVSKDAAAELLMELVVAGNCSAVFHAIDEADVRNIMRHPRTMIASDGGVEGPSERVPHPRNYGSFARVLGHYVREQGVLPLHTAVHKITRVPANRLGLDNRGRISAGAIADIVVFDPAAVIDRATFADPHQYAEGLQYVFVAGTAVLKDGSMTGARPGRLLRSGDYRSR